MDVLESTDRQRNDHPSVDPLRKYIVTSKAKKSDTPSTFHQTLHLKSNYDKSLKFIQVVLVILIASLLLVYLLNRPKSEPKSAIIESEPEKSQVPEEEETIDYKEMIKDLTPKRENVYHFSWLSLESLRDQKDLENFLDDKIRKEFKGYSFEKEIGGIREKYLYNLKDSEGFLNYLSDPEKLERKIEVFLANKRNLLQIYEKGFNLTDEILKSIQEYGICKADVFSEKDKLMNISLENERNKMQIKRYQGELEEMDRILSSQMTDTQALLKRYESEKRNLMNQANEKQRNLNNLKSGPENLRKELENLNKNLLELDNKEKLQKEIIDNSDEIERIKRRMKEIDVEKEDVISNIDFLNKKLKSYDNILKVGENFKTFSSSEAPKGLLEKLKSMQNEYKRNLGNRKLLKPKIDDTKKEFVDEMRNFIKGKRELTHLDDSTGATAHVKKREAHKNELQNLEKEYDELYKRLLSLEKNIEKSKKMVTDLERSLEDAKRKQLEKQGMLEDYVKKIKVLEREIEELNYAISDKDKLIEQVNSQPKFDPAIADANKKDLEKKIKYLEKLLNEKDNEFIAILKSINYKIKVCRIKKDSVEELMKKNKIMDDFKETLKDLIVLKDDLTMSMKNFAINL